MLAIVRLENKIKITIALALRRALTGQKESQRPGRIETKRCRAGNGPLRTCESGHKPGEAHMR